MSNKKTFLILTMLFSLLFIALIALGSHWLSLKTQPEKQFGIAAFLFAFAAAVWTNWLFGDVYSARGA